MTDICNEEDMRQLLATISAGTGGEVSAIERLIGDHPGDARLHFLRGSLLAGSARPIEAHAALSRAVALAPDFALARFQLGLFELTSGEPKRAIATWDRLREEPALSYLATFVTGLVALIEDRFADAIALLRTGIAANGDNPPLNNDMQLIIDQCETALGQAIPQPATDEASATSFLLGQLGGRGTTH